MMKNHEIRVQSFRGALLKGLRGYLVQGDALKKSQLKNFK